MEEDAEVENKKGTIYGQNKQGREVEQIEKLEIVANRLDECKQRRMWPPYEQEVSLVQK